MEFKELRRVQTLLYLICFVVKRVWSCVRRFWIRYLKWILHIWLNVLGFTDGCSPLNPSILIVTNPGTFLIQKNLLWCKEPAPECFFSRQGQGQGQGHHDNLGIELKVRGNRSLAQFMRDESTSSGQHHVFLYFPFEMRVSWDQAPLISRESAQEKRCAALPPPQSLARLALLANFFLHAFFPLGGAWFQLGVNMRGRWINAVDEAKRLMSLSSDTMIMEWSK